MKFTLLMLLLAIGWTASSSELTFVGLDVPVECNTIEEACKSFKRAITCGTIQKCRETIWMSDIPHIQPHNRHDEESSGNSKTQQPPKIELIEEIKKPDPNICYNCKNAVESFNVVMERSINATAEAVCKEARMKDIVVACLKWSKIYMKDLQKRISKDLSPEKVCREAKMCSSIQSKQAVRVDICTSCVKAMDIVKDWVESKGGILMLSNEISKNICSIFPEEFESFCQRRLNEQTLFLWKIIYSEGINV